ncbi:MAG: Dabb family protein [Luteolibacter sp.]|uniref:Dabb family protein n=1 Tax=Luteolibacter sp. TaxID=1962973 RepID=UPI0032636D59
MKSLLALTASLSLVSCATIAPPAAHGTVDHVVLMWQKRPGNAADREKLLAACSELRVIPGIKFLDSGTALASERPVVDDSFDVGLTLRFDSATSLHAYETDPRHVKKVNEVLKPLTKKIVVYDIIR